MNESINSRACFKADFVLNENDTRQATEAVHPWMSSAPGRIMARVVCGLGGLFFLWAPSHEMFSDVHGGWAGMWRTYPIITVLYVPCCIAALWAAAGQLGLRRFEARLNHLNERRTYTFSEAGIAITMGSIQRSRSWKTFFDFVETDTTFILRTHFLSCLLIPKSALEQCGIQEFREFLVRMFAAERKTKLRNQQQ